MTSFMRARFGTGGAGAERDADADDDDLVMSDAARRPVTTRFLRLRLPTSEAEEPGAVQRPDLERDRLAAPPPAP